MSIGKGTCGHSLGLAREFRAKNLATELYLIKVKKSNAFQ
jgi:cysteine synthase